MNNTDRQLENHQQEIELHGRCGAETIYKTDVVFTISGRTTDIPQSADLDAATLDFDWFLEAAREHRVTAHTNPSKSFWIKRFGHEANPYGMRWNFRALQQQLERPGSERRAVLFNPAGTDDPPCILAYQFQWIDGLINCTVYMRSCDIAGVLPQDIVMTRMLLRRVCEMVEGKPGSLTFHVGNAHVYYSDAINGEEHEFDVGL